MVSHWLSQGVLRQGWGGRDLREVGEAVAAGSQDHELKSIWRLTQRMLDIDVGDIVVTPHQPNWGLEGVWRVTGPYRFDRIEEGVGHGDFGNVLDVEFVKTFDHRNANLSKNLRRALTSGFRMRMRQLDVVGEEIQQIIDSDDEYPSSDAAEHFDVARSAARDALRDALINQYHDADFEKPVGAMLESLYPGSVTTTAGAGEKGRDFVVEDTDKMGLSRSIVVQVKSWSGSVSEEHLNHGLEQLRRGIEAQGGTSEVDLAVLLTLASDVPVGSDLAVAALEDETGVPVVVMLEPETLDLMLDQISEMTL